MKRSLRNSILLLLTAMLLTVSALADSGPKAQLTVKVVNAPSEPYYLDLLEKGDYQGHTYGSGDGDDTYSGLDWSYSEEEIAALDDELLDALRAAVPEGWHACTAQGTNGVPMWGDLIGSDAGGVRLHSFRYHGVPDTYRIILVTNSGESWVSDTLHRATLQSSATVDWAKRTASAPSAATAYLLQFFCTLLPTLLIEGVLLLAFGYRSRRSLLVFLLVNLVTQGGFALYLAVTVLNHGSRAAVLPPAADGEGPRARGGLRRRRKCLLRDGGVAAHRPAVEVHRQHFLETILRPARARKRKEIFSWRPKSYTMPTPF